MEESKKMNVAVIGAGVTGLTTAFYLKKAGIPVHVFEQSDRTGGVIQTHHENGFIYESGPNTGVLSRPEAAELFEDLAGDCILEPADDAAKARWIWKKGKWHALPSGLIKGVATPLFTFPDKLRLLGEPFRRRGKNPNESLAGLVLRRMGKSFLDYAIDPFILGIYSGDPARLVTRYAFPKLYWLEQDYGSFIGGSVKKAREPKRERDKKATKAIFSTENGLSNLIHALERRIGRENISLNCRDLVVSQKNGAYSLKGREREEESYTHVIATTGGYALPGLFPFLPAEKLAPIRKMSYSQVAQVSLGFKTWEGIPLGAFGGLVPSVEKRDILGILFISSFLKNRAPEKGALLSVFLGGVRKPEMAQLSDSKIIRVVEKETKKMLQLQTFAPDLLKIFHYKHAIPQYGFESEEKMNAIKQLEKQFPGLILAGNTRDGIGIADRIKQGRTVAEGLIKTMKRA